MMKKRTKIYMTRDQVGVMPRMSVGQRPDDMAKLVQERDWGAYLKSLEPIKPFPVTRHDVQRLAAHFKG